MEQRGIVEMTSQQLADLILAEYQLARVERELRLTAYVRALMLHRPSEPVNPAVIGGIVNREA